MSIKESLSVVKIKAINNFKIEFLGEPKVLEIFIIRLKKEIRVISDKVT
jgi:hypothetical protein